ncbi:MAG TPA: LysR family transcriptional regulator [Pseudogracilibacillus sp.]|nr:LysR family transcriptional regulator [Pseudogracilibacillus sp.]HZW68580.1 LysR family transcriptional regulator [Pseudogracilibacillus sp.]
MELRQLKYFIEVAKREHVTEAANVLHVAQSAVSRQIFNLEEELGVDLFIREGRTVRLTRIGKIFLEHAERALHVIEDAKRVVEEYRDPEKGTIHIGFSASLASYILPTAISYFRKEYPHVQFVLNEGSYSELIDSVIRGEINMALLGPLPQDQKKIKGTVLFTEDIVALLPSSHRLAERTSIKLTELRDDPFVLYPKGYVLHDVIMEGCLQRGFRPQVAFEGKDLDAIKGLVSAGLGVTMLPEVTLIDNLPRATARVPIVEPSLKRTVGIIVPKERELLPTEKEFFKFIRAFFKRIEHFQQ